MKTSSKLITYFFARNLYGMRHDKKLNSMHQFSSVVFAVLFKKINF